MRYEPAVIEPKWQAEWDRQRAFEVSSNIEELKQNPKYYVLDMFPYPSGSGLHVGHPEGYTATDVIARMKRMQGFNVMHPMGWDAFGLPAERAAMRDNIHPAVITKTNIDNFRRQIKRLGFSYDWTREISTSSPDYYKWTQWIFLKLYEKGLAYLAEVPVNWCPALCTVLANEEVKDGRYVETGDPVEQRMMRQWMLRITAYAERLLTDLDSLDWPEGVKEMQRNWIGKSDGSEIDFQIEGCSEKLKIYTTRADTLLGVTFCVIAYDHPLNPSPGKLNYFTGLYALHPITGARLPIWVADYVLSHYGTGAVMAVPKVDERDGPFARQHGLPIVDFEPLEESKWPGVRKVQYRLRDWLFSRQRYWGEPVPVVLRDDGTVVPLTEDQLPVELPPIDAYKPTEDGRPPLARAGENWLNVSLPEGQIGYRETNTMPQWAGSCWYYLRYLDPTNSAQFCKSELEQYWMPVDLYVGGVEHAVLHLLYARFWHKVLYDCGVVHTKEPFQKLFNQGMILAQSFQDQQGKYYYPEDIDHAGFEPVAKSTGRPVKVQVEKMSKSRYNVINPDEVIEQYGADAMRLYELFMGPLEQVKMWQMAGVEGVFRFLNRVWRLRDMLTEQPGIEVPDLWRSLHKTIRKITEDTSELRFNTAVSQMMTFVNDATALGHIPRETLEFFLRVLNPYAPHIAEELWHRLGHEHLLAKEKWPEFDPAFCVDDLITIVIQVNGKRREELSVKPGLSKEELELKAMSSAAVIRALADGTLKKVIVVLDRIVNVVIV